MVVSLVILAAIFLAALLCGIRRTDSGMDDYCGLECWDVKVNKNSKCCQEIG